MLIFLQFSIGTWAVVRPTSSRRRPFCFHNFVFLLNCLFVLYRPIFETGRRSAVTHYSCFPGFALAACPTPCRVQASLNSTRRSCSRRWTAWHRRIWRMIVILSLVSYSGRQLRSADNVTCSVPRTRTLCGDADRSFIVAGPRVWKSLPAPIRTVDRLSTFKRLLKTHLFNWDRGAYWLVVFRRRI